MQLCIATKGDFPLQTDGTAWLDPTLQGFVLVYPLKCKKSSVHLRRRLSDVSFPSIEKNDLKDAETLKVTVPNCPLAVPRSLSLPTELRHAE